jgi:hypothetical protein
MRWQELSAYRPLSAADQAYVNLRGYFEFAAKNRADGWNVYVTFGISPAGTWN